MPAIGSDSDTYMLCNIIRRTADICGTFSFEHSVDVDTSKSRNIAIVDIAKTANMSLSPRDQLAKSGYSLHARDTSVRSKRDAMLRSGIKQSDVNFESIQHDRDHVRIKSDQSNARQQPSCYDFVLITSSLHLQVID